MAQTPNPKSQEQIVGEMLADWISRTGVNDINTGSLSTQFFEVVGLMAARTSGDAFQILRDLSVDRAEGEALRRIATDEGLRDIPARVATGAVTVTDTSFTKISTKVYAGTRAPNIGSTSIYVSDASNFSPTGSLYIGRGTPNVEGPIAYTSVAAVGGYWQIFLSSATTKFHNINESVVLAQGGARTIAAGSVVRAPSSGATPDINFTITQSAVILDGETSIENVQVSAQEPGTSGNIPIGGIKEFSAAPFSGAEVTNPLPFKTGRDVETDEELRIRIKRARLSRGLGTALAVKNSVIGATPSDENSTVVSSEIITSAGETTLFIDDNTGYEQKTEGVGIEYLVDSALGGETNFQLETGGRQTSVVKAFIVSNEKAPFDVSGTDRLAVSVGGVTTEHIFEDSDFISPGGATAYEIVASINANSSLNFEAATSEGGTKVVLQAKTQDNEQIQAVEVTTGRNTAELMGFPFNEVQTLRLFKNKNPLSKDGLYAVVETEPQANWQSLTISDGDTLTLSVDGTANITYTIYDSDFINEGTYSSVSATNSLESWVNVLNSKLTGATASLVGEQIFLTSNLGVSDRASIVVDPTSTLVTKNMFSTTQGLSAQGKTSDYEFSRNTAQIKLKTPLAEGDELSAGTADTEARIEGTPILGGSLTLASAANVWILFDDINAEMINTGVSPASLVSVSKPSANIIRYTSSVTAAFSNVKANDYVIIWSAELSSSNRIEGRVRAVSSTSLDIKVTAAEYASATVESNVFFQEGFVVVRTAKVPQRLKLSTGTKTVGEVADELNSQLKAGQFFTIDDEILALKTNTKDSTGSILFVSADSSAKVLGFEAGNSSVSSDSLIAFTESGYKEGAFPAFIHSDFNTESFASPPDSYISTIGTSLSDSLDPNYIVGYLQPYANVPDALSPSENTFLNDYVPSTLTLDQDSLVKRLRTGDRFYLSEPMNFGHEDQAVAILDGDTSNKSFEMPLYRRGQVNSTIYSSSAFNAYDTDAGATSPFTSFFTSFSFANFKLLMQAKRVLNSSAAEDAILFRSVKWGRSGEHINVGYSYPTVPNSSILHTTTVDENINVRIFLKSGAPVATNIDGTTEWDVTITPNTPVAGVDQVTYTSSAGTAPNLASLSGGEYVTINQGSELSSENTGTFRLSTEVGFAPTSTSFTVVRKNGEAVAEANKATLVPNAFSFYLASNTTAADIVAYVSSSILADIVTATLVDDSGTSGAGVIGKSTAEDSDFSYDSLYLLDGVNWIESSNVSGSPQFLLKRNLSYTSDVGYVFQNGENIRLVPTSLDQSIRFLNVLAVTGYTTLGEISLSSREGKMQLATSVLGGSGSIQIIGGSANSVSTPIVDSSSSIENSKTLTAVARAGLTGLHSDQWVKLQASTTQPKETLFKDTASVLVNGDYGTIGESKVRILNRTLVDRHFGKPRHHVRPVGRNFKIEKQGDLVCVSWVSTSGTEPYFSKSLNLNDAVSGTYQIEKIENSSEVNITVLSGDLNFTEVSINDTVEISGTTNPENSGSFLVVGVSNNGEILRILNPNAIDESSSYTSSTFACTSSVSEGDTVIISSPVVAQAASFSGIKTGMSTSITIVADNLGTNGNLVFLTFNGTDTINDAINSWNLLNPANSITLANGDGNQTPNNGQTIALTGGISAFSSGNLGTFRVIRRYLNSIYIDNPDAVEESVYLDTNPISVGHDATTQFNISATDNKIRLAWNGVGTEPTLGAAKAGDQLVLGAPFAANNQGTFMITRAEEKLQEITRATCVAGNLISSGNYWEIKSAGNTTSYYVWYSIGGGGNPLLPGKVGIQVLINGLYTAQQVATATKNAINLYADFSATVSDNIVTITTSGYAEATDATPGTMNVNFEVEVLQNGQRTFIEAINPIAVTDSAVATSASTIVVRPQMLFYEYDATIPGDTFEATSDFLGNANIGAWTVLDVLDQDTIIVDGSMEDTEVVSASGYEQSIYIEEGTPYSGYKKIHFVLNDPTNLQRGLILFDTKEQFSKINELGGVELTTVNKLGFKTTITKGLDSYRYHTGLIGEANRIVYGDPRDPVTYPGVAAAGAEIFIREPLFKRIQVSIDVRIETGIPFVQITEQVRTNVTALIDSNPIGQAIAISDIVETVNTIPGVRAVAISSPLYNPLNDTIMIQPSEKARIIDPTVDITVRRIGT